MEGIKIRKLAAVMFTDIVGYTALMQKDEILAVKARTKHRRIFEEQHSLYNGKIIQYFGDGTLSIFDSAIEAAECAIQIQRQLQSGEIIPLRIGLHLGDIVFNETEIYGDGVNMASRIESMCTAGAIFLSEKINDELINYQPVSTISLGLFNLKNISKPTEIFAITNKGVKIPQTSKLAYKRITNNKTIAVLPFQNFSTHPDNEYFSDGITEEIINALAKVKSLRVTSRTSSFAFKNKDISIKKIAKELGVSTIIEGSVRISGDTIRITAQLIQAEEDFHFWSETWDRKLHNIFKIQDEISLIIAEKLREQFGHFELEEHLIKEQTNSFQAYEYYLKAQFNKNKWNPEDIKQAIILYEKALELDSNYADAYLGLADSYSFLGTTGFMSYEEAWGKTIEYTNKALEKNCESSGFYYQQSNQAFFIECDYGKSLSLMKKSIELNPNNAEAQQFISFLYIIAGDQVKAKEHLDISYTINPLSKETLFFKSFFHYMIEDYQNALEMVDNCLASNNKNIPAHSIKTLCLLKLDKYNEAINYFDTMPSEVIIPGEKTGTLALAYALSQDSKNTLLYKQLLIEQAQDVNGFTSDSFLFLLYAVMGDNDSAFEWASQALNNKSSLLLLRYSDPIVNNLKNDPRYAPLHQKIYKYNTTESKHNKKKNLLSKDQITFYTSQLLKHIAENKPFLDTNLSLQLLAEQISIHPNQLSWLLNESIGKNFNEFINHFRVSHFKEQIKMPKNADLTILAVAYDCGFSSKSVFNSYFKKETGLTPKQFIKSNG